MIKVKSISAPNTLELAINLEELLNNDELDSAKEPRLEFVAFPSSLVCFVIYKVKDKNADSNNGGSVSGSETTTKASKSSS